MVEVVLPWPKRILFPNAIKRKDWYWGAKSDAARQARGDAKILTLKALDGKSFNEKPPYKMTVVLFPPDSRKRDMDAVLSACKYTVDGMCLALGIDDYDISYIQLIREASVPSGEVSIMIEGIE